MSTAQGKSEKLMDVHEQTIFDGMHLGQPAIFDNMASREAEQKARDDA